MRSYTYILCGLLVTAAMVVLAGCANDESATPVHAKDLGSGKGEVLVPYEPVISRKITQDPSQFQMPEAQAPASAEAPASSPTEGGAAAAAAAGDEYVVRAKQVVENLTTGQYAKVTGAFDATLKAQLSEAQLEATWSSKVAQVGAFQELASVRREQIQGLEAAVATLKMEKASLEVRVIFNAEKAIGGLMVVPAGAAPVGEEPTAPAASPAPDAPAAAPKTSGSSRGMGELPPTAPAPIGLGN